MLPEPMQTTRASFFTRLAMSVAAAAPAAAVCLVLAAAEPAAGASYEWSPEGTGTWDATSARFFDGATLRSWSSVSPVDAEAVFSGTAGTVTIGAPVLVNKLRFTSNGYSLAGGNLSFVGTGPSIWIDTGSTVTSSVTITGAALALDGGGTFQLAGINNNLISSATDINLLGGTTLNLGTLSSSVGGFTLTDGTVNGSGSLGGKSYLLLNGTVNAFLDGDLSVNLTKSGAGTVTLNRANTFTGNTVVNGGLLYLGGNNALGASERVQVSSGGTLSTASGTFQYIKQLSVQQGGTFELAGSLITGAGVNVSGSGGTYGVLTGAGDARGSAVSIASGGVFAPGSVGGIGTFTTGNLALGGGGAYNWDVNLSAGASSWDRIAVIGGLSIGATVANPFVLNVNGFGAPPSTASSISWAIATYTGSLAGFSSDKFLVNLGGSWTGLDAAYRFSVTQDPGALYLTMAVPEPKDYAMILGAVTLGLVGYRRWRRTAQPA